MPQCPTAGDATNDNTWHESDARMQHFNQSINIIRKHRIRSAQWQRLFMFTDNVKHSLQLHQSMVNSADLPPLLRQTTSELWCVSGGKTGDYQNCSVLDCIVMSLATLGLSSSGWLSCSSMVEDPWMTVIWRLHCRSCLQCRLRGKEFERGLL